MSDLLPGETILIRGVVGRDGVVLGPGIEVHPDSLDIVADVPVFDQPDQPVALVMFFASDFERQAFAEAMADEPGVETREIDGYG